MTAIYPSVSQILAEWLLADPGSDLASSHAGMSRYEADGFSTAETDEPVELMRAGRVHWVAGTSIIGGWAARAPTCFTEPSESLPRSR
jgi:hypothetical protein